MHPAYR
jgi:hypothetical protein